MAGNCISCQMSAKEWRQLPVLLGVRDMAALLGVRSRWVSDHAEELGGRKIAQRWRFSKSEVAKMLGIDE